MVPSSTSELRLASSQSMDETQGMYGTLGCKGQVDLATGPGELTLMSG